MSESESETVTIPCLGCGKLLEWPISSNTGQGIFNSFCPDNDGECEDRYAIREMLRKPQ